MNRYQPILDVIPVYIAAGEGYIFLDHGSYTVDEMAADIIDFAVEAGMPFTAEDRDQLEHIGEDPDWRDDTERTAIDYLNTHHAPEGAWWGHDGYAGAFGCWLNTKDNA